MPKISQKEYHGNNVQKGLPIVMTNVNCLDYSLSFGGRKLLPNNDGQIQRHDEICYIWK